MTLIQRTAQVLISVVIFAAAIQYPVMAEENSNATTPTTATVTAVNGSVPSQDASGDTISSKPGTVKGSADEAVKAAIQARQDETLAVPFREGSAIVSTDNAGDSSVEGSEGEEVEHNLFSRVWDYLAAKKDETSQRAVTYWEKRKMDAKYGPHASDDPNFTVIAEAEKALVIAEDVRITRELNLDIERNKKAALYEESLMCLALNGYYESRGETADQEIAANAVVLNRLSVGFRGATTVCEVIMTPDQFSWVKPFGVSVPDFTNSTERKSWERSLLLAKRLLDPDATYIDPSNGAVYYYAPKKVNWKYAKYYIETAVLGNHRFMREKKGSEYYIDNSVVRINPVLFNGLSATEREALKKQFQTK